MSRKLHPHTLAGSAAVALVAIATSGCASTQASSSDGPSAERLHGAAIDVRNGAVALHNAAVEAERAGRRERALHLYATAAQFDPALPEPARALAALAETPDARAWWEADAATRAADETARVRGWSDAFDGLPAAPTSDRPAPAGASAPFAYYFVAGRRPGPARTRAGRRRNPTPNAPVASAGSGPIGATDAATAPTRIAAKATLRHLAGGVTGSVGRPRHRGPRDEAEVVLMAHDRIVDREGEAGLMQANRRWAAAAVE